MRQLRFACLSAQIEVFNHAYRPIDRNPGFDLGVSKVTQTAATNFPDAIIGPLPHLLEVFERPQVNGPGFFGRSKPHLACGIETTERLAVHVDLELVPGAVADVYWPG